MKDVCINVSATPMFGIGHRCNLIPARLMLRPKEIMIHSQRLVDTSERGGVLLLPSPQRQCDTLRAFLVSMWRIYAPCSSPDRSPDGASTVGEKTDTKAGKTPDGENDEASHNSQPHYPVATGMHLLAQSPEIWEQFFDACWDWYEEALRRRVANQQAQQSDKRGLEANEEAAE